MTKPLAGKRIGIVGKGGAGKSTTVVLLARALTRLGYRVWVLDADSTNVGLHQGLGLERCPAPLVNHFGGMVFSGGRVTCPVDDPRCLPNARVVPAVLPPECIGESPEGIMLLVAGKLGEMGPGAGCDGPIGKIARDVWVDDPLGEPVMLVDFKAGFEDSARGVITGLHWALVMVDPTAASVQLALHTKQLVAQIGAGKPPATHHLLHQPELIEAALRQYRTTRLEGMACALSRCPNPDVEAHLRRDLARWSLAPIGVIHEDAAIATCWLDGTRLDAPRADSEAQKLAEQLEATRAWAGQNAAAGGPRRGT